MISLDPPVLDPNRAREAAARPLVRVGFCAGEQTQVQSFIRRLFGRLDPEELAALTGGLPSAEVEMGVYRGSLCLDFSDPPRYGYRGVVRVVPRLGRPILVIDALHIHQPALRGHGLGLRVFSRLLAAADRLGLPRIETDAGRRDDENGYYTWPRYGFAGRLPEGVRRDLPPELAGTGDVLELMQSEAGRAWWRRFGVAMRLAFDVRHNSPSRRAFVRYCSQKGSTEYHG